MGETVTIDVGNSDSQIYLEASKLLNVLSKSDALLIFSMARDGIEADGLTYARIGLTKKQYYTRLMQLKDTGLIEKRGNCYFQTTKGSFIQESCISAAIHAVSNGRKMAMIDVLRRQGDVTEEDLLQMKRAVCAFQGLSK
jgi:hypothetical protein